MIPGGWGNVSRHWSAAHGPTRVITTDSKTEQSECDWSGTMFCPMAATDSNRHISQVNCLTCILYKWQLHVLDEWISYFYCQMLFKYMFHDVCLDSCSFTPNKCVCVCCSELPANMHPTVCTWSQCGVLIKFYELL